MKPPPAIRRGRRAAAFTLTELALCIAVVGVALVAIIGVLPSGLNVQKENREDTLIASDAKYLIEAIRSGSIGIGDLTNYVDFIRWQRIGADTADLYFRGPNYTEPLPGNPPLLTSGEQVVALFSTPREQVLPVDRVVTNIISAQFRSFNSPFVEKPYNDGPGNRPQQARLTPALRYLVGVEVRPAAARPAVALAAAGTNNAQQQEAFRSAFLLSSSLSELTLVYQWPAFRVGGDIRAGAGRRVFRTQVFAGRETLSTNFFGTGYAVARFTPAEPGNTIRTIR
jgi:type II secretory pathway pseudopilin PulG